MDPDPVGARPRHLLLIAVICFHHHAHRKARALPELKCCARAPENPYTPALLAWPAAGHPCPSCPAARQPAPSVCSPAAGADRAAPPRPAAPPAATMRWTMHPSWNSANASSKPGWKTDGNTTCSTWPACRGAELGLNLDRYNLAGAAPSTWAVCSQAGARAAAGPGAGPAGAATGRAPRHATWGRRCWPC
jgi:hypothetical protein